MTLKDRCVSRRELLLGISALPYALSAASEMPASPPKTLSLAPLRARFKGDLIVPGDALYETARLTNNRVFDRHPLLIARCVDAEDVARCLDFARTRSLPIAVRSGGHCQAGRSSCDGGVVIDLSRLDTITVEPGAAGVSCGPGVRVYQANAATVKHGLALPLGICGDVGVAGLTLGGGYGYLLGVAGLACDSLIGAEVVLADGRIRKVTEESDPDLMWALRGGGANFGIVTALHFKAFKVGEIFAGSQTFPKGAAHDVAALVNESAANLPDELTMFTSITTLPDGSANPEISMCWSGDARQGRQVIDKFTTSAIKPSKDSLKVTNINELVGRGEGTDGLSCVRYGEVVGKLPTAGLQTLLNPRNPPAVVRAVTMDALHGAATRRKKEASAAPSYSPGFGTGYLVFWQDPKITAAAVEWTNSAWAAVHPFTQAAYVNMLGDESAERVREAYGDNYPRLTKLKAKYDPDNVFRLNQNIKPG
jgi:FAD/FMN-containing dehydrogenase